MDFVVTNASTLCSDADVKVAVSAITAQLADVAKTWDRQAPTARFVPLSDYPSARGDAAVVVFDDADQAGALGYHSVDPAGRPYARVFARDSIAALTGFRPDAIAGVQATGEVLGAVAPVLSHEMIETLGDEWADEWADDGQGTLHAFELCDAVESDAYTIEVEGHAVTVSDWLTPDYFDPAATDGPFDWMAVIDAPFTLAPGGYEIVMADGEVSAVFGDALSAWRRTQHEAAEADAREGRDTARLASRTGRRFAAHLEADKAASGAEAATQAAPQAPSADTAQGDEGAQQQPGAVLAGKQPGDENIGAPLTPPEVIPDSAQLDPGGLEQTVTPPEQTPKGPVDQPGAKVDQEAATTGNPDAAGVQEGDENDDEHLSAIAGVGPEGAAISPFAGQPGAAGYHVDSVTDPDNPTVTYAGS